MQSRSFSTTFTLLGKRNFRKFPVYNKRGTQDYREHRKEPDWDLGVRQTGHRPQEGRRRFVPIPEMVPEIIVPDLTDFKLKPYVSYRVPDVVQSEFTPEDLFDACYADKVIKDFKEGKLHADGSPLEPSEDEKRTADEAWARARQTGSDVFEEEVPEIEMIDQIMAFDPQKDADKEENYDPVLNPLRVL